MRRLFWILSLGFISSYCEFPSGFIGKDRLGYGCTGLPLLWACQCPQLLLSPYCSVYSIGIPHGCDLFAWISSSRWESCRHSLPIVTVPISNPHYKPLNLFMFLALNKCVLREWMKVENPCNIRLEILLMEHPYRNVLFSYLPVMFGDNLSYPQLFLRH